MKIRFSVMSLLVGLCLSSVGLAQDYEIRLERTSKVGERCRVTASVRTELKSSVSTGGQVIREESETFTLELVADVTVLAVDEHKRDSGLSFTIIKFDRVEDKNRKKLLAKGTVVVAAIEKGEQVFRIGKRKVDAALEKALSSFVGLPIHETTDDEVRGTADRKKVGDSWPIDRKKAARQFEELGVLVAAEDIKGKMTLENVIKIGDVDCLQIRADTRLKNVDGQDLKGWRQNGFEVKQSTLHVEGTSLMPVDVEKLVSRSTAVAQGQLQVVREQGPNGPKTVVNVSAVKNRTTETSEIPPEADDKKK